MDLEKELTFFVTIHSVNKKFWEEHINTTFLLHKFPVLHVFCFIQVK